jgi:hypothetical protein
MMRDHSTVWNNAGMFLGFLDLQVISLHRESISVYVFPWVNNGLGLNGT